MRGSERNGGDVWFEHGILFLFLHMGTTFYLVQTTKTSISKTLADENNGHKSLMHLQDYGEGRVSVQ